jgi:hypothetical protein
MLFKIGPIQPVLVFSVIAFCGWRFVFRTPHLINPYSRLSHTPETSAVPREHQATQIVAQCAPS